MMKLSKAPMSLLWLVAFAVILPACRGRIRKDDNPTGRDIHIINRSEVKVDIFWVNPSTQERVMSVDTGILRGTESVINSYIGHEFEVIELPKKTTGKCVGENDECRKGSFVVTSNEDQHFIIQKDISISYEDSRSRALEKAKKVAEECPMPQVTGSGELPNMDEWAQCLQQQIDTTLDTSREEIEFQAGVRKDMGRKLVNYACNDEEFPASTSTFNQTLNLGLGRQRNPEMRYLFQSETSKVVLIENFVARSQCKWLKETAAKSGTNKLEWSAIGDVAIRTVVERVYKALDQVLEYKVDGEFLANQMKAKQSHPLFEVQKSSKTANTKRFLAEQDRRHPLMASFMLFCDVPETGGYIHFPKAGVHVKPEAGQALLVSYTDPDGETSSGDPFTSEHVECPIVEGESTTLSYHIPLQKTRS